MGGKKSNGAVADLQGRKLYEYPWLGHCDSGAVLFLRGRGLLLEPQKAVKPPLPSASTASVFHEKRCFGAGVWGDFRAIPRLTVVSACGEVTYRHTRGFEELIGGRTQRYRPDAAHDTRDDAGSGNARCRAASSHLSKDSE